MVTKILQSLVTKFNYVVCVIEESNHLSALTILMSCMGVYMYMNKGCRDITKRNMGWR